MKRLLHRLPGKKTTIATLVASLIAGKNIAGPLFVPAYYATSMWQESTGVTPAVIGQPVGLMLDMKYGGVRGAEIWSDASVLFDGESSRVSPGVYRIYSSAGAYSAARINTVLTVGKWYEAMFTIDSIAVVGGGIAADHTSPAAFTTVGAKVTRFKADTTALSIKRVSTADYQISNISVREIPGSHASQATSADRPTLSARVNLLTNTAFSGAVAGTPGTAPTSWPLGSSGGTLAISGASLTLAASTGLRQWVSQTVTLTANTAYRFAFNVTAISGTGIEAVFLANVSAGSVTTSNDILVSGGTGAKAVTITAGAAGATVILRIGSGVNTNVTSDTSVTFDSVDFRLTADTVSNIPAYQRVNTSTDYDTVGFPVFLDCNGVNQWMSTAAIDFTDTDKMTCVVGVRKSSDAVSATVLELTVAGANGSISLFAPVSAAANYQWRSKGTALASAQTANSYAAPITNVLAGTGDISGDISILRVNGSQAASSVTDQGTGNYSNAVLYLFRRGDASLPLNGRFYGAAILGCNVTPTMLVALEKEMALLTGITI